MELFTHSYFSKISKCSKISTELVKRLLAFGLMVFFFSFLFFFCLFKTGFPLCSPGHPGTYSVLFSSWPWTQRFACFCLPSAGIQGIHHHHPACIIFSYKSFIYGCMYICVLLHECSCMWKIGQWCVSSSVTVLYFETMSFTDPGAYQFVKTSWSASSSQ